MTYDKKIAELFLLNFNEAYRSAKLLMTSFERVAAIIPLKGETLLTLTPDQLDRLDAFRVRYCDLQDGLGNKTFRTILLLEEEIPGSNLDVLNKMEKREIIHAFEEWKILRNIRNLFSHDYPETDEDKAEALNTAYCATLQLIQVVNNVIGYMQSKLHFPMDKFPVFTVK